MEDSGKIFKELESLERTREGIERRWLAANNAPDLRELVMEVIVREKTGPREELERLQTELNKRLQVRDAEKNAYLSKWKELRKSLEMLTMPVISNFILEFAELSALLQKKCVNDIIDKSWDGFKGMGMLRIRTNSPSMGEVREKINKAVEIIRQMNAWSIPMIEKKAGELMEEIKGIDLSRTIEKEVSEDDFYRGVTPQGIGKDYAGPRSGLRS